MLVPTRKQKRELVASEAEGLSSLAQAGSDLGEHPVADRMAVAVVDLLEVVDVEQAHGEREPVCLGLVEVALKPLVEMAMVAEPGQRIGEGEPHGLQGAVHRALVQGDGDERADERDREERRALPEDGEHQAHRSHDRERAPRSSRWSA